MLLHAYQAIIKMILLMLARLANKAVCCVMELVLLLAPYVVM